MPSLRKTTVLLTVAAAGLSLVVAGSPAGAASTAVNPYYDPFYRQPSSLGTVPNGSIISSRQVTWMTSTGTAVPLTAYQLKYRSQDSVGNPVADVTTVILPANRSKITPTPVLSYQVAEDSLGLQCAPSYALTSGTTIMSSTEAFLIMLALAQGWVVSVPDYEGAWSQFAAGAQAAHAVLDGVKAVQNFAASGTSADSAVGLWGYSGGGQATAWAGELQGRYAPDLNVVGVAEGGVPADVESIAKRADGTALAGLTLGILTGLSRAYPWSSLGSVVNDAGKLAAAKAAVLCSSDLLTSFKDVTMASLTTVADPLDLPQITQVFNANKLGQYAPEAPVYDYHAIQDEFIPIGPDDAVQAWYCSMGVADWQVRLPTGDHLSVQTSGSQGALAWLADRFTGKPAPSNCPS